MFNIILVKTHKISCLIKFQFIEHICIRINIIFLHFEKNKNESTVNLRFGFKSIVFFNTPCLDDYRIFILKVI